METKGARQDLISQLKAFASEADDLGDAFSEEGKDDASSDADALRWTAEILADHLATGVQPRPEQFPVYAGPDPSDSTYRIATGHLTLDSAAAWLKAAREALVRIV